MANAVIRKTGIALSVFLVLVVFAAVIIPKTSLNTKGYELTFGWVPQTAAVCEPSFKSTGFPFVVKRPMLQPDGRCLKEENVQAVLLNIAAFAVTVLLVTLLVDRLFAARRYR
jgi:hypothetical protein